MGKNNKLAWLCTSCCCLGVALYITIAISLQYFALMDNAQADKLVTLTYP